MAGTWQAIINGFAGVRVNGGGLELHRMYRKSGMVLTVLPSVPWKKAEDSVDP